MEYSDFITKTNDFYEIESRLKVFTNLAKDISKDEIDLDIGEKVYSVFSNSHPTEYLRSNPGGRFLKQNLANLSDHYIKSYLKYIIIIVVTIVQTYNYYF